MLFGDGCSPLGGIAVFTELRAIAEYEGFYQSEVEHDAGAFGALGFSNLVERLLIER